MRQINRLHNLSLMTSTLFPVRTLQLQCRSNCPQAPRSICLDSRSKTVHWDEPSTIRWFMGSRLMQSDLQSLHCQLLANTSNQLTTVIFKTSARCLLILLLFLILVLLLTFLRQFLLLLIICTTRGPSHLLQMLCPSETHMCCLKTLERQIPRCVLPQCRLWRLPRAHRPRRRSPHRHLSRLSRCLHS